MSDFTLEPDEIEPERRRPARLVGTGLHPTAEVPTSTRQDHPPVHVPCEACGGLVVTGQTPSGTRLALDLHVPTYTLIWHHEPEPVLYEARSYPVHRCPCRGGAL